MMTKLGEQVKSTSLPQKESSNCSMPSSSQLPHLVNNHGLALVPTLEDQPACCRAFHNNRVSRSGRKAIRTEKHDDPQQPLLFLVHQQRQHYLFPMAQHPGATQKYWDGALSSHQASDMDHYSSEMKSERRQQSLMTDHSMPNGYSFGTASPPSLATASSSATESAFFPAGFAQSLPLGYHTNGLSNYLMVKPDPENAASPYLHAAYHTPTLATGVPQLGISADSQVDQFGSWANSLQDSHLNMGYEVHGLPIMSSVGGCFTPRPMAAESPSMISYQQDSYHSVGGDGGSDLSFSSVQPGTAGAESFCSTADSPDSITSMSSAVLSDGVNGDHEASSYSFSSANRNSFSHGANLTVGGQQHQPAPTIVLSTLHSDNETVSANSSFDSTNPVWTQPSPSMATSTDSLPRTMIFAKYTGQHDPHGLMPYETQYHSGQGDLNPGPGAPQLVAPRPRRPLPSCAPAIEGSLKRNKKDKRSRGSVSRSPSPKSQTPASRTMTRQRPKKLPKRRPTPLPSSASSLTQPRRTSSLPFSAPDQAQTPVPHPPSLRPQRERAITSGTYHQLDANLNTGMGIITNSQAPPLSPTSSTSSSGDINPGPRRNGEQRDRRAAISPAELAERKRKDEYLLWAKDVKGWTYSEIKKAGGFTEAESTLRGRYRMLHKRPEERIRKPKWMGVDIRLLEKGVRLLATNPKSTYTPSGASGRSSGSGQHKKSTSSASGMVTRANGHYRKSSITEMDQSSSQMEEDNEDDEEGYQPTGRYQPQPAASGKCMAPSRLPEGLADLSSTANVRIPWGKVAEYIATHGGTYRFGNSTCKKRWLALVEEQVGKLGKDINSPFSEDLFQY